ncbi:hypothetical protein ACFUN7_24425 [Streptomyces sp. NPDC057236]|uniref:hypothetical protein n=1 Tax=Streptomyces sp. NPDC057236 TaxID=3346059 RepID=UPI00363DBDD4
MTRTPWAGDHLGRDWTGHAPEDNCPCPKAACGLVLADHIRDDCTQHAWTHARSMRQSHPARNCPARTEPKETTMTRPYTDDDLRAEAARQHANLTEDPDYVGVGKQMEDAWVPSVETTEDGSARKWGELLDPEQDGTAAYDEAQRKIHDLINGAADTSEWAINLGADSLQPDSHQLTWSAGEQPIVRVHFAFHERMHPEARDYLVTAVGEALQAEMERAAAGPAVVEPPAAEACGKCRTPFNAADTRYDGDARFYLTPYCRRCVAGCHDTEIADHRCVICA